MKRSVGRITNQKKIILEYLKSTKDHPSAEMVYRVVKRKLPRISFATVYRILNTLKGKGEIVELPFKVSRYDGDNSHNSHFICEKCHTIFDIYNEGDFIKRKRITVGRIKNYQIYFYGICKNCR